MLAVLGVEGDWLKVDVNGEIGYIYQPAAVSTDPAADMEPEAVKVYSPKKVTIFTSRRVKMALGELVSLTSRLEGFEDCEELYFQWECDKGAGFEEVSGANSDSYSFEANVESLRWNWRLQVYYR